MGHRLSGEFVLGEWVEHFLIQREEEGRYGANEYGNHRQTLLFESVIGGRSKGMSATLHFKIFKQSEILKLKMPLEGGITLRFLRNIDQR